MRASRSEREVERIGRLAQEFARDGYAVMREPADSDLPAFLRGYRPDLVAERDDHHVVVEVKSRGSLRREREKILRLSHQLDRYKDWEFQLVLTNPKRGNGEFDLASVLSWGDIHARIRKAEELLELRQPAAAFLMAWTAVEAVLRHLGAEVDAEAEPTATLLKRLASYGLVSRRTYQELARMNHIRNLLAHGFSPPGVDKATVRRALNLAPRLERELGAVPQHP